MFKALKFNLPWKRKDKKIKKIVLGICAMDKKARSKPMREIIERLPDEIFEVVYFGDECILREPIEQWPIVEVLIAFYSTKFPTQKALQYVKLRKPFMINDLDMQEVLKDRRKVYETLESVGIDVPFHVYVNREGGEEEDKNVIEEFDEYIVVNGVQINKPLVEKPVDAEDHNIYIYYPMHAGGGSKRLFRKIDDRSSEFYPQVNEIRRVGSYIYEEFVLTHGTDVKVYTVGSDYGHAEARKSPVVDGRVKRDSNGREVRFPVILSPQEKEIARKIVRAFKQTVCGFDILRVQGKSYCCDVNGFSFVKNSRKYYDDASQLLTEIMVNAVRPEYKSPYSTQVPLLRTVPVSAGKSAKVNKREFAPSPNSVPESLTEGSGKQTVREKESVTDQVTEGNRSPSPSMTSECELNGPNSHYFNQSQSRYEQEELRGVIAIVRHGDRTPKQKIKLVVTEPRFLEYFHSYVKNPTKELKVKSKSGLLRFLEVTRGIIKDKSIAPELRRKLYQIRDVLERWEISGINRKLQMKPLKWDDEEEGDQEDGQEPSKGSAEKPKVPTVDEEGRVLTAQNSANFTLPSVNTVGSNSEGSSTSKKGSKDGKEENEGADKKEKEGKEGKEKKYGQATEILIILKWGGDLTPLGREQAENLGAKFRTEHYPESDNGGVLRLHATYRHDLKIKASDEGRVIKTAAAFTKGLLALEGQLTPIISSLVTMEEKNRQMLDRGGNFEMKEEMDRCKDHLNLLQVDQEIDDQLIEEVAPECSLAMRKAFKDLGNPLQLLKRMHYLIGRLTTQLEMICAQQYALYEAQIEAQLLVEQQATQASSASSTVNNSVTTSQDPNDTSGAGIMPTANRDRTASSGSVNVNPNGQQSQISMAIDNDTPSYSSNFNSPRPVLTENNMQYIELGAPEPSPTNPNSQPNSSQSVDIDANIFPANNTSVANPAMVETEPNSIHKIELNSNDANEIDLASITPVELYLQETCDLMWDRWDKLYRDFYNNKKSKYDLTKVPDVYDMIRYDLLHNSSLGLSGMEELFQLASKFERCVVPQEYGTDKEDKRYIGSKMCGALLEKIKHDLNIASAMNCSNVADPMLYQLDQSHAEDLRINSMTRCVRTRLYFTSESHLHTVLNILKYAKSNSPFSLSKEGMDALEQITDVSYLSQIIIRLFQDRFDSDKYSCEISFSSGTSSELTGEKKNEIAHYVVLEKSIALQQLMGLLDESIELYRSTREERLLAEGELGENVVEIPYNPLEGPIESTSDLLSAHTPDLQNTSVHSDQQTASPHHTPVNHHISPLAATQGTAHAHSTYISPHAHSHYTHHHSTHSVPVRRNGSITVNIDELNSLTSDRWENSAPKSNTKTFMASSRSFTLTGLPGHVKVPKPLSLHPSYIGLFEEEEGMLLGNTPRGVNQTSYYNAFKARRAYNPNPQMKAYTEQFMRKGSPNTHPAATKMPSGLDGMSSASKSVEALSLHVPKAVIGGSASGSPVKFEGRGRKCKEVVSSAPSNESGSPITGASLTSEKDSGVGLNPFPQQLESAPLALKRQESFGLDKVTMQPITIMETGHVVLDGGSADAPASALALPSRSITDTPVRMIKVVEVGDDEHLKGPSLAEAAAASTLNSGTTSPNLSASKSHVSAVIEKVVIDRLEEIAALTQEEPKEESNGDKVKKSEGGKWDGIADVNTTEEGAADAI